MKPACQTSIRRPSPNTTSKPQVPGPLVFGVCPPLKSVAYYARQCFSLLNPAFDRVDAGYFVDVFLLAVNSREFFVEMISSPLRQFFDRVYAGASEKLRVLPADSLDSKEISFVDPF